MYKVYKSVSDKTDKEVYSKYKEFIQRIVITDSCKKVMLGDFTKQFDTDKDEIDMWVFDVEQNEKVILRMKLDPIFSCEFGLKNYLEKSGKHKSEFELLNPDLSLFSHILSIEDKDNKTIVKGSTKKRLFETMKSRNLTPIKIVDLRTED